MADSNWVSDDNGNRCSAEYFGSIEGARKALASLNNCKNCTNCSGCSGCSRCSHVAYLENRKNLKGDPTSEGVPGAPPVPVIPDIHRAVYAAVTQPRALDMSTWHKCETTHCRAGWVVTLAGEAGRVLERFHNTPLAAQLIYLASDPANPVAPTRFYETNEVALADMKRLAELPTV